MDAYLRIADTVIETNLSEKFFTEREFIGFAFAELPQDAPVSGRIYYDRTALPFGSLTFWSPELMIHKQEEKTSLVITCGDDGIKGVFHCVANNKDWNDFTVCRLPGIEDLKSFPASSIDAISLQPACRYILLWQNALIIHASAVILDGRAYLFLAPSGTGKSTHTDLWLSSFNGSFKLNDDQPVVRCIDGNWKAFGSIWSGSEPFYRNEGYELAGMCVLVRSPGNSIRRLQPLQAFAALAGQVPLLGFDDRLNRKTIDLMSQLCEKVPFYYLSCLPDREAAEMSRNAMAAAGPED